MRPLFLLIALSFSLQISAETLNCSLMEFDRVSGEKSVLEEASGLVKGPNADLNLSLASYSLRYRLIGDTQLVELFSLEDEETPFARKAENGLSFYGIQLETNNDDQYVYCQLQATNLKGLVGDYLKRRIGLYSLQVFSARLAKSQSLQEACRYSGLVEASLHERSYVWYDMLFYFEKSFRQKASSEDVTSDPWLEIDFLRFSQECSKAEGDLNVLTDAGSTLVKVFDRVQAQLLADRLER